MLSEADSAQLKIYVDELNATNAAYDESSEDFEDAIADRIVELDTLIQTLENPAPVYMPEDMAIAGVFLSLDRDGSLRIDEGYVLPQDRRPEPNDPSAELDGDPSEGDEPGTDASDDGADGKDVPDTGDETSGRGTPQTEAPEDMSIKPLPDSLHRELTAYRTLMLRNALARHPDVALSGPSRECASVGV